MWIRTDPALTLVKAVPTGHLDLGGDFIGVKYALMQPAAFRVT